MRFCGNVDDQRLPCSCHPEEAAAATDEGSAVVSHHISYRRIHLQSGNGFTHKWKEHEGFTARYNCDRLVWFERHQDVHQAIAREKELKGWRRSKKIALIKSGNPAWIDLSRDWYEYEPADYRRALDRMEA